MVSKNRPYISVSGASVASEAKEVGLMMRECGLRRDRGIMPAQGIQVSYKCLDHGFSEGNRRVPFFSDLPELLDSMRDHALPIIHYYTKKDFALVSELTMVMEYRNIYSSGKVHGVQINGVFPRPGDIEAIKEIYPKLNVILQLHPEDGSEARLAKSLSAEYKSVDYLILDYSQGKGKGIDIGKMVDLEKVLRDSGVEAGIVYSGGIHGGNVETVVKKLRDARGGCDFSIDAEGGLRDRIGDGYGNDTMNLKKVRAYLEGAVRAFGALYP